MSLSRSATPTARLKALSVSFNPLHHHRLQHPTLFSCKLKPRPVSSNPLHHHQSSQRLTAACCTFKSPSASFNPLRHHQSLRGQASPVANSNRCRRLPIHYATPLLSISSRTLKSLSLSSNSRRNPSCSWRRPVLFSANFKSQPVSSNLPRHPALSAAPNRLQLQIQISVSVVQPTTPSAVRGAQLSSLPGSNPWWCPPTHYPSRRSPRLPIFSSWSVVGGVSSNPLRHQPLLAALGASTEAGCR